MGDSDDSIVIVETKKKATRSKKTVSQAKKNNNRGIEGIFGVLDTTLGLETGKSKKLEANGSKIDYTFSDDDSLVILTQEEIIQENGKILNSGMASQILPVKSSLSPSENGEGDTSAPRKNMKGIKKDISLNKATENKENIAAKKMKNTSSPAKRMRGNELTVSTGDLKSPRDSVKLEKHVNNPYLGHHQWDISDSSFLSSESSTFLSEKNKNIQAITGSNLANKDAKINILEELTKSTCAARNTFNSLEGAFNIDKSTNSTIKSANPLLLNEPPDNKYKSNNEININSNNRNASTDMNDNNKYIIKFKAGDYDKTFALNGSDSMEIVYNDLFENDIGGKLYYEEMKLSRFLTIEESGFFPGVNYISIKDDENLPGMGSIEISVKFDENVENNLKVSCVGPERVNDLIRKIAGHRSIDLSEKLLVLNGSILSGESLIADYFTSGDCVDIVDAKLIDK